MHTYTTHIYIYIYIYYIIAYILAVTGILMSQRKLRQAPSLGRGAPGGLAGGGPLLFPEAAISLSLRTLAPHTLKSMAVGARNLAPSTAKSMAFGTKYR